MSTLDNPAQSSGIWGPVTAVINFCEDDYQVTSYIAEFINTLTNIGYVYYGLCGLTVNWRRKPFADFNCQYLALIFVGIGSGAYHMSMKRSMEAVDQMSMLIGAAIVLHRVVTFDRSRGRVPLGIGLTVVLAVVFWIQQTLAMPIIHFATFAGLLLVIFLRVLGLIRSTVKDEDARKQLRSLALWGYITFSLGFIFWMIDVHCCSKLKTVRSQVGLPWAWVFEFHGWWHLFTGAGVYLYMVLVEYLHLNSMQDGYVFETAWPAILRTPVVQRDKRRE
ncbi:hypothetical protein ASPZODRAFT_28499 [Penicilliopsis zonata CBS 506.65]|uniref:Alkaline phytoceramidase n=1 Tax=Penicilliopsis zonata CBS 506.65 TaxID=1073090 RepID=A0A1L9S8J9_9EURO|nr:hypothetical protein ASPZODRAFT_28499 [Penicilliopsis zonata CBS 506.65]OJJ43488.1 hypothetical protein ASPZODRAFT_28499 [Penicilliopsis zonata CBS 506.65]